MLTEAALIAAGYKRSPAYGEFGAAFVLSLNVNDDIGTRFVLNIWVIDQRQAIATGRNRPRSGADYRFKPVVQFREPGANVEYFDCDADTISDVEDFFTRLWLHFGSNYYTKPPL
jgi:hypothetical protein